MAVYSAYIPRAVNAFSVTSNTTLQNDGDLIHPVLANGNYQFYLWVNFNVAGILSGYKFQLNAPASPTSFQASSFVINGSTGAIANSSVLTTIASVAGGLAAAGDHILIIEGLLANGNNSGNLQFQMAQNVSNGAAITRQLNSFLRVFGPIA